MTPITNKTRANQAPPTDLHPRFPFGGLPEFESCLRPPASSAAVGEAWREAKSQAMRTIIISLLLAITPAHAADKATSRPMTNAPVLKVDDAHWMSQPLPGQKAADPYSISSCASIILDATGYRFDPAKELRDKPLNSIQIIQNKTHQFELAWETNKTRYELSSTTLRAKPGSQPFMGFAAGDKVVVAVGVLEPPTKFFPVWFSIIEVK